MENKSPELKPTFDRLAKEYLQFTCAHENSQDTATNYQTGQIGNYTTTTTTWKRFYQPFFWKITRPQTDHQRFTMNCPVCGKILTIDVDSLSRLQKITSTGKTLRLVGWLMLALSVLLVVLNATSVISFPPGLANFAIYFLLACVLIGFILVAVGADMINNRGFSPKGDLLFFNKPPSTPFDGHYIQNAQSRDDQPW